MNRRCTLVTALALSTMAAACAANPGHSAAPSPQQARTTVEVTNNNWSDMVVYAVLRGTRFRLGLVTSMSSRTLDFPRNVTLAGTRLKLAADPIGSREIFVTQSIDVTPGQYVEFNIQNHLAISSYAVWNR